jgi:DNA-binding TFAR19-related protein (PDSD5 family)
MYNFKHQIHKNHRFNTYELYIEKTEGTSNSYKTLRNALFFTLLILAIFITGAISLKNYQEYKQQNISIERKNLLIREEVPINTNQTIKLSHSEFSKAITNSVVHNLQSKHGSKKIDNDELKRIIKKVVNKLQEEPETTKYTQQQRKTDVL